VTAFVPFFSENVEVSKKRCSFELSIHQRILKNKMHQFPHKYEAAKLFPTLIIIINVS